MFVVMSYQNGLAAGMLPASIVALETEPHMAVRNARQAIKQKDSGLVSQILIFEAEPGQTYGLKRTGGKNKPNSAGLVCIFRNLGEGWHEEFIGEFKKFNRKLVDRGHRKASPGKFVAIVNYDSDTFMQIDNETDTPEEALDLCTFAAGNELPCQIWDDQGRGYIVSGRFVNHLEEA